MRKLWMALIALTLIASGIWAFVLRPNNEIAPPYKFTRIARGDLENLVSGTGTLSAVGTVEVGTQVSGTIDRLLADFNQRVEQGQLLAVLDTSSLAASVRDAEAGVARARAQHNQAVDEYERHVFLAEKGYLSESELRSLATTVEMARAGLQSAEAMLHRARTSLQHAEIRAPIDGTIIQRSVEAGQTVAASLQTPTLFVIVEDLARMEILALVDESDIGRIREGQEVRFTVQTYPDEEFHGQVRQIRLQPQTLQNVVNYTVVVDAPNQEGILLPGMTATVDFVVESVEDVLLAPAAALRFQPTQDMLARFREKQQAGMNALSGAEKSARRERFAESREGAPPEDLGRLWYLDENGGLAVAVVRTGATDGLMTEIEIDGSNPGVEVAAGLPVISGVTTSSAGESSDRSSGSSQSQGRRMGPPPLF